MKTKISILDFSFEFVGYRCYKVTYTSPATGKSWSKRTNHMSLINATKNADKAKKTDLEHLKWYVKQQ